MIRFTAGLLVGLAIGAGYVAERAAKELGVKW